MLEAAQAAVAAGHCGAAAAVVQQIYPLLESRRFEDVPREVWLAAYPIPFESSIRRWSAFKGIAYSILAVDDPHRTDPDRL